MFSVGDRIIKKDQSTIFSVIKINTHQYSGPPPAEEAIVYHTFIAKNEDGQYVEIYEGEKSAWTKLYNLPAIFFKV